ncbi:hypothetical protein [Candidatus Poriferisodalis sp.]|uniref:hypothetical protein n=1 Tax=Candidatus Poriferisodalis sp. TaxID=3101277 RepID=UPI003B02D467
MSPGRGADRSKTERSRGASHQDARGAVDDSIDAAVTRFTDAVEAVRSRTSGPLVTAVRALVYGVAIATAAVGVVVLVAVAAVRALDIVVPGEVWAAHLIMSAVFGLAGAWAWSKRRRSGTVRT